MVMENTDDTKDAPSQDHRLILLRQLPTLIQTASVKERQALFNDLNVELILNHRPWEDNVQAAALQRLAKQLISTPLRYQDSHSRRYVRTFVFNAMERYGIKFVTVLVKQVHPYLNTLRNTNLTCPLYSHIGLDFLNWLTHIPQLIAGTLQQLDDETLGALVESYALATSLVLLQNHPIHVQKLHSLLHSLCQSGHENVHTLLKRLSCMSGEQHPLPLWALWAILLQSTDRTTVQTSLSNQFSTYPIDLLVKHVIPSRGRQTFALLSTGNGGSLLASLVTNTIFAQQLLPAFQKAILRNPEVAFEIFPTVIQHLNIRLDQHVADLAKVLSCQLISKQENLGELAVQACAAVASRLESIDSVVQLIKHLVGVFNGSEGKLTIVQQRCCVVSGLGSLEACRDSFDEKQLQTLAEIAIQTISSLTKNELHEGTLLHIGVQLRRWAVHLRLSIPNSLFEWFKSIQSLKTSTPTVKAGYIGVLKAALHPSTYSQFACLSPTLAVSLSKVTGVTANQQGVLLEALNSANFFLTLFTIDGKLQMANKETIINTIVALEKLPFLGERFITTCEDERGLMEVCFFIERIYSLFETNVQSKLGYLSSALVLLMTHLNNYQVRKTAMQTYSTMSESIASQQLLQHIVKDFKQMFLTMQLSNGGKEDTKEDVNTSIKMVPNALIDCLRFVARAPNHGQSKETVCTSLFAVCHLPSLHSSRAELWYSIAKRLLHVENVQAYVEQQADVLVDICYTEKNLKLQHNCIMTLANLYPQRFLPLFLKRVLNVWSDPQVSNVTRRDYEIFCTPDDELYDMSVIEQAKEQLDIKNMRRENKLYSYKEQMEELKLRKELEARRKPELSKKQLEAKRTQLDKEQLIRLRVKSIHESFVQSVNILNSLLDGNSLFTSFHLKSIVPSMLGHLQSPLCAADMAKLYMQLHRCVVERGAIGCTVQCVQATILRQLNPICALNEDWESVSLEEMEEKLLSTLHQHVCGGGDDDGDEKAGNFAEQTLNPTNGPLRPTTFTLILPFFAHLLQERKRLDHVLDQSLEIISEHVQLQFDDSIEELEDLTRNPSHLPRKTLLDVLIRVIENRGIVAAKQASKVLLQTATCVQEYPPGDDDQTELPEILLLLVDALKSHHEVVRSVALEAMLLLEDPIKNLLKSSNKLKSKCIHRLWVAQFDTNEACSALACDLWISCSLTAEQEIVGAILNELNDVNYDLLEAVASAVVAILREHPSQVEPSIQKVIEFYKKIAPEPIPKIDAFGRPIHDLQADAYHPRLGVALILTKLAPLIPINLIEVITHFHVPLSLGDINTEVRKQMLESMVALIQQIQPQQLKPILDILQKYLEEVSNSEETDKVRTSVVVLMGRLAGRLDKNDPKIKPIIGKLIETLSTPSQMVQEAVSSCLPDLCPCIEDEAETLIDNLIKLLLDSDNYGEKKGAAYGIAGFVRGFGIRSMRNMAIIDRCLKAIQNKKSSRKLGALIAFEVFCSALGQRFEPYVVCLVPGLLASFGDTSENIRRSAQTTARAIMNSLTEHGVRFILPSMLKGLNSENWRTKVGSIELLGAMAYCAPRQLSQCLPAIVPKLMEVLCDSHSAVQTAANQALQQIGSVIRNPEIQAIVPTLLQALDDPANKTQSCLVTMLNTKFVHFIDAPSLALIMPVIERAFQARSTGTRKMAAQIIGNMYSLTDHKDLAPYLPGIVPGIKQSLLDPVPDVRAATARALGAMVRGMGDQIIGEILPWLMSTLTSEASSVDRSGAAQGLAEVIGGLGLQRLTKLMPEIIATSARTDISPYVKDGYLMLYIYLPIVFTQDFTVYIGRIIHPILKALADEHEFVRETAFKAGQRVVGLYASSSIQLLLPELEKGLFDENWRIRYSSVQLLGDLLYKISGVSGKMTTETAGDDDNFGTEKSCRAIMATLGTERRNRVLSGLYMGRMDVSLQVRQAALHVWKIIVSNTPRTLKEILPTLFSLLLGCLASKSMDQQQVAARTLGDLVRKLGERILPQIIPILEEGLRSERSDERQGVCIGLSEIIANTSKEMIEAFVFSLVPTVRKALCDPLPEVRQAAASTFDSLHGAVGNRALEEIIPSLLQKLQDPQDGDYVLDGLRNVLSLKGQAVLPYLIPQLTIPPVNPRALSLLSSVSGEAMGRHLLKLLPALLGVLRDAANEETRTAQLELCQLALQCIQDESSVQTLVDYLLGVCKQSKKPDDRYSAALLLQSYCTNAKIPMSLFMPQLLRGLISFFVCDELRLLNVCWDILQALVKSIPKDELGEFASDLRSAVRFAVSDYKVSSPVKVKCNGGTSENGKKMIAGNEIGGGGGGDDVPDYVNELVLPGFSLARGINPVLTIYREALVTGGKDQKEFAAAAMCELIKVSSPQALQGSMMHIAGPLIRMLAERVTSTLKISLMDNLSMLIYKNMGQYVKPFLPQMQQSLVRCALDSCKQVRTRSAGAIAQLLQIYSRADAVMIELNQHLRKCINNPSGGGESLTIGSSPPCDEVGESVCYVIRMTANILRTRLTPQTRAQLIETVSILLDHQLDSMRLASGSALGALSACMTDTEFHSFAKQQLLSEDDSIDWTLKHGRSIALWVSLKECPQRLCTSEYMDKLERVLSRLIASDRLLLVISGIKGVTFLIQHRIKSKELSSKVLLPATLLSQYTRTMNHATNEVKTTLLQATVYLARSTPDLLPNELLRPLLPMLVNGTKEKNTMVRANSEQALIYVLGLRNGDERLESIQSILDPGPRESLQICVAKTLRRVVQQPEPKGTDKFDDSIIS